VGRGPQVGSFAVKDWTIKLHHVREGQHSRSEVATSDSHLLKCDSEGVSVGLKVSNKMNRPHSFQLAGLGDTLSLNK
jgi:hypothetical protein